MAFPANTLESVLVDLRAGATDADRLLETLAGEQLWVPLPQGAANGEAQLPIMVLDGEPYVAVYTSSEQYQRGAGQQAHMVIQGRALAEMMAPDLGLAVNPGAELGLPIRREGVATLRGDERQVPSGQPIRLGHPAEEPQALLDALANAFETAPAVVTARRALAQFGDQPPFLLVGIEPDTTVAGWQEAAVAAVKAGAASASPLPLAVEATFLAEEGDPVTAWMRGNTEPFYVRSDL